VSDAVQPLVATDWLAARLGREGVAVVDGSWHLPTLKRDAKAEFLAAHVPGAVFFDIDAIADHASDLPHMLPSAAEFGDAVGALGIANADHVVVYDTVGLVSAARVWWTFRAFGHDRVSILDGGLVKWRAEGRPLEGGEPRRRPARFAARFRPELVRAKAQLEANVSSGAEQVLDARAAGRFAGTAPEPRAGLRGGHIPGSRNLPVDRLVDPATKTVLPPDRLAALFREAGIDSARPVVTTCGSGITASALAFALFLAGNRDAAVYDGSWSEWGRPDAGTPVATGP
jgi:thiosulfate/3-mercaptopyruvate sulfurtransferase